MEEARMRLAAVLMLAAALAACADRLPVDAAGRRTALPPPPSYTAPRPATAITPVPVTPAPAAPVPPPKPADSCGGAELAYLVGKSRTEIPVPVDLTKRRVVCEGCPTTMDFRAERQTIWFDQASGKVTRLTCG